MASQAPAFVLTECPSPAPQGLYTLLRLHPHYKLISLDYIAAAVASSHCLSVGYKPTIDALGGRYYAVGNSAQRLPRQVRLLLFGNSHWEIDISGAHYELMRRQCKTAAVHLELPPIAQARESLRIAISTQLPEGDVEFLVKTWPLVIINSATPQEAIEYLRKRLIGEPSRSLVCFAREVFAASRYAMHHPPPWCPPVADRGGRGAPFHYFEVLGTASHMGCLLLSPVACWFHISHLAARRFWVAPRPGEEILIALQSHLCRTFSFDPTEAPLMRCDPLQPKLAHLLSECANPSSVLSSLPGALPTGLFLQWCIFTENALLL